jgi:hypothetical protein
VHVASAYVRPLGPDTQGFSPKAGSSNPAPSPLPPETGPPPFPSRT